VVRYDGVLERSLSSVLLAQGKLAEAEFFVRRALQKTLERVGRDSVDAAQALALLSNILSEQGRNAEAVRLAEASLRAYQESGASEQSFNQARARQFLGAALAAQGRHHDALAVFERNREILARDPDLLQKYGVGHPEWVIALLNSGRAAEAERMASSMLEWTIARFGDGNPRTALRRALIGVARVEQGDFAGANKLFEASVPELLAQARDDVETETGSLRKQRHLVFVLEAWLRSLASGDGSSEGAAAAFRIADIARGSGVQRALTAAAARSNIGDPELAGIARQEQDAQRRQVSLSNLLVQMLGARPEEQLPKIQEALRRDIARLLTERDALRQQIADRFPDYAELVRPPPVTLARAQASLRPGEVLVSMYVGERESYVWALSGSGVPHFYRVPAGRDQVAKEVAQLRRALDAGVDSIDALPAFDVAAAHSLYARFLAPAAPLWREAKTLIVIPHGDLAQLPFALLPTAPSVVRRGSLTFAGYREVPWLVRQVAVQQLPSAVALVSLRRLPVRAASVGSFAGFGDPLFSLRQAPSSAIADGAIVSRGRRLALRSGIPIAAGESATLAQLPALPDTGRELRAIARALKADPQADVFLQREATEQRVMEMDRSQDLARRRVVMFATHGLVPGDLDGLTQPALALTSPEVVPGAGNGLLTMDDVLSLRMDADWVVLSACNTASGEGAGAEAVSGLGRAFFYAGARAMLVSNWPVETVSARLLMTEVFNQQGMNPSLSKSEALRHSMLMLIDSPGATGPGGGIEFSYAHPLFWAPFVVVGD
jgi:CHAT domain-containing protein